MILFCNDGGVIMLQRDQALRDLVELFRQCRQMSCESGDTVLEKGNIMPRCCGW